MSIDRQRIDALVRYFDQFYQEEHRPKRTSIGYYRPTNLHDVRTLFDKLDEEGFLQQLDIFADAGGGDGRIAALASLYEARAYSIEGDKALHTLATRRIGELAAQGILEPLENNNGPWLVEGDFLDPQTYIQQLHVTPRAIDVFFNAGDNEQGLSRFIKKHGKDYSHLILMQSSGALVDPHMAFACTYRDAQNRYLARIYADH